MPKLTGLLFLVGENAVLYEHCFVCHGPLAGLREQTSAVCAKCLCESGATLGVMLVVHPPSTCTKWN